MKAKHLLLLLPLLILLGSDVAEYATSQTLSKNATTEESSAVRSETEQGVKESLTSDVVLSNSAITTLGDLGLHQPDLLYLGVYKVTFYTASPDENGGWVDALGNGITKTGNPVQPDFTAAVKHGSIPYGTPIYIPDLDGQYLSGGQPSNGTYIVDDCGVGVNHIDIAVDSKATAEQLGVQWLDVYALKEP